MQNTSQSEQMRSATGFARRSPELTKAFAFFYPLSYSTNWEPTIRDGRLYARGADDDKGQAMVQVKAFEYLVKTILNTTPKIFIGKKLFVFMKSF